MITCLRETFLRYQLSRYGICERQTSGPDFIHVVTFLLMVSSILECRFAEPRSQSVGLRTRTPSPRWQSHLLKRSAPPELSDHSGKSSRDRRTRAGLRPIRIGVAQKSTDARLSWQGALGREHREHRERHLTSGGRTVDGPSTVALFPSRGGGASFRPGGGAIAHGPVPALAGDPGPGGRAGRPAVQADDSQHADYARKSGALGTRPSDLRGRATGSREC